MANSDLTRTISSAGNLTTWTFSAWVKFCEESTQNCGIFSQGSSGDNVTSIFFNHSNGAHRLEWRQYQSGSYTARKTTNRSFNDRSAWYHIVCQWDTTNGTAGDRMKIWVNGERETSFESSVNPSSSLASVINSTTGTMNVGKYWDNTNYMNGYMAHVAFVNGAVVAPTVFGETDSTSGIWKFKSPSGVTWGTNGFHLKFENSGALGTDSSGNSNTFTVNGNLKQALDTPSNVYATMNPLDNYWQSSTFANGNNTITTSAAKENYNTSTLAMPSNDAGKYYCEVKIVSASAYSLVGLADKLTTSATSNFKNHAYGYAYDSYSGNILNNGGSSSYGNSYTTNDIIGIAVDTDNNKLYFSKNGTWQNSGDPTSGSTGTGAISISATTTNGYYMFASGTRHNDSLQCSWNFGNGFFGTTAISSAGSNGNGSLFEYDVPSGYYALNTKNINTYG